MKWIKSAGGPLVCLERYLVANWSGAHEESYIEQRTTDYERACQVQDYLGRIKIRDGEALVLGDMPLETSVWQGRDGTTVIVRLFYADPTVDIPRIINALSDDEFDPPDEHTAINIHDGEMVIFDAAMRGDCASVAALHFELPVGRQIVLTKAVKPGDRTSLLLHKFALLA
jgi:hypothetical protein